MHQSQSVKTGIMPGTNKLYSDFELVLASLYKTFKRYEKDYRDEVRESYFRLNGYLNTLARWYGVREPHVVKDHDPKWYDTAVFELQGKTQVLEVINSIATDFRVYETQYMCPLVTEIKFLLEIDKN